MPERIPSQPEGLTITSAQIRDVASFIVGVYITDQRDLVDETWIAVRDYSKLHSDFELGDPFMRFDVWRSVAPINPVLEAHYRQHPHTLHRPFVAEDPTDLRIVHIQSLAQALPQVRSSGSQYLRLPYDTLDNSQQLPLFETVK